MSQATPQTGSSGIESVLNETRVFPPPPSLQSAAHIRSMEQYRAEYQRSIDDPEGYWGEIARQLDWFSPWKKVLDFDPKNPADTTWFIGGTTNICHNCLDRQIAAGLGDQVAIIWEGEPVDPSKGPEVRRLTYRELHREVCKFANVLKSLGVTKGDAVTLYMPMIPELAIAMLACARIGAPHSIIFGGFSAQAIADRVYDAQSKVLVTADGGWRRGQIVPLKENVDAACTQVNTLDHVIVFQRTGQQVAWHHAPSSSHGNKRDHWWHDLMAAASSDCAAEPMDSEDLLFILYTSGSTGKPKGIMHTTGGYMVHTYLTSKYTFDLHPAPLGGPALHAGTACSALRAGSELQETETETRHGVPGHPEGHLNQVHWCTADIGWVTGHSYIIYGILPNRVPTVMYEGAPNFPDAGRFWDMIKRHKVTSFYTAPTAIRAFMKWGDEHPKKYDLSSLLVLGSVGEPINPEAWMWYREIIGGGRCPIVDTWWQTETGGHMITPLPACTPTKPGSCTLPFFGVDAAIVDEQGIEKKPNEGGLLAIRRPWPSMLRGILNDRERFIQTYWSRIRTKDAHPYYLAGDGARRDADGYFWIMGRIDDVINVSGHRLGTMEVESALVSHGAVVEAAVVGMPHEIKGTGIAAFVTLAPGHAADDRLKESLREHVQKEIGAIAKPDMIRFTDALPKTRSGKIMRRLLRDIAAGVEQVRGDTTTLEDFNVLAKLRADEE